MFEGFPREWAEGYSLNLPIDMAKVVESGFYQSHIRPSELPSSILSQVSSIGSTLA